MKKKVNLDEKHGLRALTRGEIKTLRKNGLSIEKIDKLDPDRQNEMIDCVLEMIMAEKADELPNPEALSVFNRIIELTYGDEKSEKNSSRPGKKSAPGKNQKK